MDHRAVENITVARKGGSVGTLRNVSFSLVSLSILKISLIKLLFLNYSKDHLD